MSLRSSLAASVVLLAALAPPALASNSPDPPPPGPAAGQHHVHRLKPWKAKYQYRVEREVVARYELNVRSDLQALVPKGSWWPIDCQLYNRTQGGRLLFDHIHNVGWVPDQAIKTYSDGRLQGSPTCRKPGAHHVWFKQPWGARKEYRFKHRARLFDRPGGAPAGKIFAKGAWTTINCHRGGWVFIDLPGAGSGFAKAAALRFWQPGLPARLRSCVPTPPPLRTWVAMGDSYASGQGANDYSGGSCRRSAHAYWALLRNRLRHGIQSTSDDFVACNGATTSAVHDHQLGALSPATRLVTISVGGDNLGFSGVVKACTEPQGSSCQEAIAAHVTKSSLSALRASLRSLYGDIRSRASAATVLVLGYPNLVGDHVDGCGAMSSNDVPALHRAQRRINGSIRKAIGNRRGFRFIDLVPTFRDHPACNDDAEDWINGVHLSDTQESFHPNEKGHLAIALKLLSAAPGFFK
jgi:hypothetical protein